MAYIFCSPKKGKGSVFLQISRSEEGSNTYVSLHQDFYSKGINVVLYNMLPLRKNAKGKYFGHSALLPTKEIKTEKELRSILSKVDPKFDFGKYFEGQPQREHEDLMFDTAKGFLAEHTVSLAEKEMLDTIKEWKKKENGK